jgi:hypothetical protein
LFVVVVLARSEALRSPKGGAFRAKRRARTTMPATAAEKKGHYYLGATRDASPLSLVHDMSAS